MEFRTIDRTANEQLLLHGLNTHAQALGIQPDEGHILSIGAFTDATQVGGITGKIWYQELHISLLWVAEDQRGTGLGKQLMLQAEAYANELAAQIITITTQDYQAADFYQHLGYTIFAELPDCPFPNTTRYYLKKNI